MTDNEADKLMAFIAGYEAGAAWDAADGHGEPPDALTVITDYLQWADGKTYVVITEEEFQKALRDAWDKGDRGQTGEQR